MSHTAQTTYYGLPIYEDKAGNQPTYLGDWNEAMRTLDSSLNSVAGQSSGVVNTANQALTTAQQAQQTANAANTVANSAQQTANGLSSLVTTAQETAEQANTAAGTAQSTAESANSAAQQASTTAANALSQAQTAASTAGTAQVTATQAKTATDSLNAMFPNLTKIVMVSKVYASGATNSFDLTSSEVLTALDYQSKPNEFYNLFVMACNGDTAANANVPIRSCSVDKSKWEVRAFIESPVQSAARINFLLAVSSYVI